MDNKQRYFDSTLRLTATFLSRWSGVLVQLWDLTPYHRSLRIVLGTDPSSGRNLVLSCLEPVRIMGPVAWQNSNLKVETTMLPDGNAGFAIRDQLVGFEVLCSALEVKENIKL